MSDIFDEFEAMDAMEGQRLASVPDPPEPPLPQPPYPRRGGAKAPEEREAPRCGDCGKPTPADELRGYRGTCGRCATRRTKTEPDREPPRCATCGGKGVVLRVVGDADSGPSPEYDPCPTCSPRSETDDGLLGALRRGRARDEDAALIDELAERMEACAELYHSGGLEAYADTWDRFTSWLEMEVTR